MRCFNPRAANACLFLGSVLTIWLTACTRQLSQSPLTASEPAIASALPAEATVTPVQVSIATQSGVNHPPPQQADSTAKITIWIESDTPQSLRSALNVKDLFSITENPERANLRVRVGTQNIVSYHTYALVTPFPSLLNNITSDEIRQAWQGNLTSGDMAGKPLLMDEDTLHTLSAYWGTPASNATQTVETSALVETVWNRRPAWGIVPFEMLDPRLKVLSIDGISPLRKDFDPVPYQLTVPLSLEGEAQLVDLTLKLFGPQSANPLLIPNRDPARLTTLAMTGVTALVRATAFAMEQQGITYPANDIGPLLQSADLTHISNEVPFAQDCPPPNPVQEGMQFCSNPRYIELLEAVGTDIVELTGDHFADWTPEAMLYTLELYKQRGWHYYGGGKDLEEGRQAITLEHNGNRLAFIGCNGKGGSFATASENMPGAVACDYPWMHAEINRLRSEGYLPIATFQHFEYYTYEAQPDQVKDFQGMAEAGAVIVSGSQAHQPQALDFHNDALIHYGLGNLFFDQYDVSLATRQGFIDWHVFYNGRHLNTVLIPIMFVDYARPRLMTPQEEAELLQSIFAASGW